MKWDVKEARGSGIESWKRLHPGEQRKTNKLEKDQLRWERKIQRVHGMETKGETIVSRKGC